MAQIVAHKNTPCWGQGVGGMKRLFQLKGFVFRSNNRFNAFIFNQRKQL